ncbi:MAG: glycoside hydrolase family 3 N-terminal domain-containing protein [Prevotella sp.]
MKKIVTLLFAVALCGTAFAQDEMKRFIDALMQKMTVEEKIGQLNLLPGNDITTGAVMNSPLAQLTAEGKLGAVLNVKGQEKIKDLQRIAVKQSRLGIPLLIGQDVIHGNQTVFPIPLAQACSWDLEAIERGARIAAKEATAQGINWVYSPMVDIAIDPRWGRIAEGSGEDPFLGCRIAEAMVRGYQGNYGKENAMACVKHFALYGAAEAGRDYNTVDMSRVRMFNQYLEPYKAAAEAGAGSFMSSFNIVDGIPATCNRWLLTDLLRDKWQYDGFVVTDYGSINEAIVHGLGDQSVTSERALKAGTDMDMCSNAFIAQLSKLLDEGRVTMEDIDTACRRVLEAKYKLGLFDDPYRFCEPKRLKTDLYTEEHRKAARDMAAETFVLLKNGDSSRSEERGERSENSESLKSVKCSNLTPHSSLHTPHSPILPIAKQGKIALIGPLADNRSNMVGCWSTGDTPELYSTLKEAMERAVGDKAQILFAQGCNIYADEATQNGATFGRPIDRVDDAQAKAEALRIAAEADVVVCAMGEMAEMSGESSSRADISLPCVQMELLKALVATGKPVVLLNFSGRPTVMSWEAENVAAILNVWFGGSETGDAICDVLFGEKSPSGRLVTTMPKSLGQVPIYYNHLNTGRPVPEGAKEYRKYQSNYIDVRNDPLYPFGYGLTYTTFEYGQLEVRGEFSEVRGEKGEVREYQIASNPGSSTSLTSHPLPLTTINISLTNTGSRTGTEVVQLYVRDLAASIVRPVKELKGFERVTLAPGESRIVEFEITRDMLSFYDGEGNKVFEPGEFEIMVGPNASDAALQKVTISL